MTRDWSAAKLNPKEFVKTETDAGEVGFEEEIGLLGDPGALLGDPGGLLGDPEGLLGDPEGLLGDPEGLLSVLGMQALLARVSDPVHSSH